MAFPCNYEKICEHCLKPSTEWRGGRGERLSVSLGGAAQLGWDTSKLKSWRSALDTAIKGTSECLSFWVITGFVRVVIFFTTISNKLHLTQLCEACMEGVGDFSRRALCRNVLIWHRLCLVTLGVPQLPVFGVCSTAEGSQRFAALG